MITLRTPKELQTIEMGLPSLHVSSWWIANYGAESWNELGKIPREDWVAYLRWFRDVLDLPVRNEKRLERIEPLNTGVHKLHLLEGDQKTCIFARKVILATGIQGGGEWHTPSFITETLPKQRYAHTSETIDYDSLKGKNIAILGGGASAFDNAQYALGRGVETVSVFMRRDEIPSVNPIRFMEQTGVVPRFSSLDDAAKYQIMSSFLLRNQPPTNDTFQRSAAWEGFSLHLGSPWTGVKDTDRGVAVTTPKGEFVFDFLVLSTGMLTDVNLRPELADVAPLIACWKDRYDAPEDQRNRLLDMHPYLGPGFQFTAKLETDADKLHGLFSFNYSALLSLGLSAAALTGLPHALPKLVQGVADQLFQDDQAAWMEDYLQYDDVEFVSEWSPDSKVRKQA